MNVVVRVRGQARKKYFMLEKKFPDYFLSIKVLKEKLRNNPLFGLSLRKSLIPSSLKKKGVSNLYRIELSSSWRLLYTLVSDTSVIHVIIVFIGNHKEYERLMKY